MSVNPTGMDKGFWSTSNVVRWFYIISLKYVNHMWRINNTINIVIKLYETQNKHEKNKLKYKVRSTNLLVITKFYILGYIILVTITEINYSEEIIMNHLK